MRFDSRFTLTRWRLLLGVVVDDVYQKWSLFVDMGQLEKPPSRSCYANAGVGYVVSLT
jgi:hypothetical protein